MDDSENKAPEQPQSQPESGDAMKNKAQQLRDEAQATLNEIKGDDGILGLFNFKKMYFPFFARVLFIIYCLLTVLAGLVLVVLAFVTMFNRGFLDGLMALFIAGVFVIASVILGRIWIELIMVAFNINEAVQDIRNMLRAKWQ